MKRRQELTIFGEQVLILAATEPGLLVRLALLMVLGDGTTARCES